MKKKWILAGVAMLIILLLAVYPTIEILTDDALIAFRYSDDFSEFEMNQSYNEVYCYNEEYDISIKTFDVKHFLCFYAITMEYEKGDMRETEFILEEEYIEAFLERAEIKYNSDNIDIARLIDGRKAVVSNTRYLGNDYEKEIGYVLDGVHQVLYVFYVDELLVIQVGYSDECPRFIAYQ